MGWTFSCTGKENVEFIVLYIVYFDTSGFAGIANDL